VCVDAKCVGSTVVIGTEVDDGDDDEASGCLERWFWKHRDRAIFCVLIERMKSMISAVHGQDICSLYIYTYANSSPPACNTSVHRYMTSPYTSNTFVKASVSTFGENEGSSRLTWYKMLSYILSSILPVNMCGETKEGWGDFWRIHSKISRSNSSSCHSSRASRRAGFLMSVNQSAVAKQTSQCMYDAFYLEGVRPQLFYHQDLCRWKYCVLVLVSLFHILHHSPCDI